MKRDSSVDVFRCLLMFGICLLHSITFSSHNVVWLANLLMCCVTGFVFISGWYGIRFSWFKFLYLISISVFCGIVMTVGYDIIFHGESIGIGLFIKRVYNRSFSHWFLNCYLVLMLLSPILNRATDNLQKNDALKILIPMFILVFVWSWGAVKFARLLVIPKCDGFGSYTYLMMVGVYVVARACHGLNIDSFLSTRWFAVVFLVSSLLVGLGGGGYASPFALTWSASAFFLMRKCRLFQQLRFASWLASSMFTVYLLHAETEGRIVVKSIETWLAPKLGAGVIYFVTATLIFCCSILVDILFRRCPVGCFKRIVGTRKKNA